MRKSEFAFKGRLPLGYGRLVIYIDGRLIKWSGRSTKGKKTPFSSAAKAAREGRFGARAG